MKTTYITIPTIPTNDISSFSVNTTYANLRKWLVSNGYPAGCTIAMKRKDSTYARLGHNYGMPKNKPAVMVKFV